MGCCKCEEYGWEEGLGISFNEHGRDYCIFHAPAEKKFAALNGPLVTPDEFNALVFSRINTANSEKSNGKVDTACNLSGAVFSWPISFQNFGENKPITNIKFSNVTFCASVDFYTSIFRGFADFSQAKFLDQAIFSGSIFYSDAIFEDTFFSQDCYFVSTVFNSRASFYFVTLGDGKSLQFENLLSKSVENIVFSAARVPLLFFRSCCWPERLGREKHGSEEENYLLHCEELYRAMKQKASCEHDQLMVSRWHYREKLMKLAQQRGESYKIDQLRKYKMGKYRGGLARCWLLTKLRIPIGLRSLTWWYKTTSGFGERPHRAFVWLMAWVILPVLLLTPLKLWETGVSIAPDWGKVAELMAEWVRCMPLTKLELVQNKDAPMLASLRFGMSWLFQVFIALQATLFALAVRNRFRR